ncbi:Mis12 protein-domain-containing protein [Lipomyces oligophaga]|uniref:Mis12 protein-domain-containing protein n=1 Tax=Lipomyces oligophaga TaxID=45792 RepID=UPI0034CECAD3
MVSATGAVSAGATALLTEHLEYPPIAFIDDVINAVNNILYKCTSAIESFLQNTPPCNNISADEIELGTAQLETLLEGAVDRNFDRFELYVLRNILSVPDDVADGWVRLSHHKNIDFSYSHDNLESRLRTLHKTLHASEYVNQKLAIRAQRNRDLIAILKTYDSAVAFLQNTAGAGPLDESVRFLIEQGLQIQQQVGKLRSTEAKLQLPGIENIILRKDSRPEQVHVSERALYLEKMAAVIVESRRSPSGSPDTDISKLE